MSSNSAWIGVGQGPFTGPGAHAGVGAGAGAGAGAGVGVGQGPIVRELSCGMPVLLEPMSGVGSVAITWLVPAGSATDEPALQAPAPMFEELVFRGAGGLDSRAQADAFDASGVLRSSSVGHNHLSLGGTTVGARLPEALALLSQIVLRPMFDPASIDPTRDLCLQALESLADDPQQRVSIEARSRFYAEPFDRSGMGVPEHLERVTRDDIVAAWTQRVRPGGSILAIAGDLSSAGGVDVVLGLLDGLLAGWSGVGPDPRPGDAPAGRGLTHHVEDDSEQVHIVMLRPAPRQAEPQSVLERVSASVLSGGMASRLFTEVREKRGLCYSVHAGYASSRDYARVSVYAGTTPERAQQTLDVLHAELERIHGAGGEVTQDELDRSLTQLTSSVVFSGESTGARASSIAGDYHTIGRPRSLDEVVQSYRDVTLERLNAYLRERPREPWTVVTLGPVALESPVR